MHSFSSRFCNELAEQLSKSIIISTLINISKFLHIYSLLHINVICPYCVSNQLEFRKRDFSSVTKDFSIKDGAKNVVRTVQQTSGWLCQL